MAAPPVATTCSTFVGRRFASIYGYGESASLEYLRHLFSCSDNEQELEEESRLKSKKDRNNDEPLLSTATSSSVRDWSELPRDLHCLIADKWTEKVLFDNIKNRPPLLLLPYNEETQIASLLDINSSVLIDMKMPELHDQWICGASKGWLATIDNNLDLFLLNPLTRARIKLPPQQPCTIERFHEWAADGEDFDPTLSILAIYRWLFIGKLTLSDDPSSPSCHVAIIYSDFSMIGVCRLGDDSWRVESNRLKWRGYQDLLFYQDKLFITMENCAVRILDYGGSGELSKPNATQFKHDYKYYLLEDYLVESCGELLYVLRYGKWKKKKISYESHRLKPQKTRRFEVYKLQHDMKSWSRVYSLDEQSLFLGLNESISCSAKEFPWCKPSCIYFTDNNKGIDRSGHQWDNGVYSLLENRVIEKFDIQPSLSFWSTSAIWFLPRV